MQINSPQEMFEIGKNYAQINKKILLYGELGAGKTHFVKGFAKGLKIDATEVKSPTYTYVNIYENKLLHIDLYRLENKEEFLEKGILDLINEFEYICIERPKREDLYADSQWMKLEIQKIDTEKRNIVSEIF